ncbi:MAG: tetratricopeptide repeat protein, partial [Chloroflexi bacterium]|nr:tetratricopeptide repeat protein [Chloroflexota bacterium]
MTQARAEQDGREQTVQLLEISMVRILLVSLFLIPLIFPVLQTGHPFGELKTVVLHIGMSLVAMLWLWQKVIQLKNDRESDRPQQGFNILEWIGRSPARWTVAALVAMWLAQLISTLLSPLPVISLFGGNENFSGGNLYDSFGLLMVFLVVAFKFRSRERLEQLAWVLIVTASVSALYGVAQHFGWDPLGSRSSIRVASSFGNTLNFSAYLGMAIPITIAMALKNPITNRRFEIMLATALALQFAGMWFSESRGPIVGGAVALAILFFGLGVVRSRSDLVRALVVTGAGLFIALIIVVLPAPDSSNGLGSTLSIGSEITNLGTDATSSDGGGGLIGRMQNWSNTLQLVDSWEVPQEESGLKKVFRPLFGLGPEMFAYSYRLVGDPHPDQHFTAHPHNYLLWVLIGQGFIGFGLFISSILFVLWSIWKSFGQMRSRVGKFSGIDWMLMAFSAGLIGKLIETQVGVARISDLAMTFALVGVVIAVSEMIRTETATDDSRDQNSSAKLAIPAQAVMPMFLVGALAATVIASWLIVGWDLRRLSASLEITFADRGSDGRIAHEGLVSAQERAPERRILTLELADAHFISAKSAWQEDRTEDALDHALVAFELLREFEKRDPYERNTQLALAKTTSTLVDWGFAEYTDEMRDRYLRLAELFPTYPSLVSTSATALAKAGDNAMAIELAERAIATEGDTKPWPVAWYAKGAALINLGEFDQAIAAFDTAIEKEPES